MLLSKTSLTALSLACGISLLPACGPTDSGDQLPAGVPESEPNNLFEEANAVTFDANTARLSGTIAPVSEGGDWDIFALGSLTAGDRITVTVDTPDSDLDAVVGIFDATSNLFALSDDPQNGATPDPSIDEVIRHDADYYLVITRSYDRQTEGAYDIAIVLQPGGTVPSPQRQTILLNFAGGSFSSASGTTYTVDPFNAGAIDAAYAGWTQAVKNEITRTVIQNYQRFDVVIRTTDEDGLPAQGTCSTIFFGGSDSSGLGMAINGIDTFNHDRADIAIVFTGNFTPDLFTDSPDAAQLGTAIGNIASHEAGHLLGLHHVFSSTDLMNGYDAPDALLFDQRFKNSSLNLTAFPVYFLSTELGLRASQDAGLLLADTIGRAKSVANSTVPAGTNPSSIAAADLNGDGTPDLAVANPISSDVYVYWNDGAGTLVPVGTLVADAGPTSVTAGDFDGDGNADLAAANLASENISVLFSDGAGSFFWPVNLSAQSGPTSIVTADLNGDGSLDLAAANMFSNSVSVLLNDGTGAFGSQTVLADGPYPESLAAGDLDGDGDVDLAAANIGSPTEDGDVSIFLNNGNGTFAAEIGVLGASVPRAVAAADLDRDGRIDLAVADIFTATVVVLRNVGGAQFAEPAYCVVGDSPECVAAADLNGDGYPDLIAANGGTDDVSVLLNNGDGTFAPEAVFGVGDGPVFVIVADLNGDGAPDLAVANRDSNDVSILLNKRNGTFGTRRR